ncbi:MAG: aminodeoxychorismate/anthranilate synthase component II [Thaumarchaeota archaeon]|nr:aminodeoxychorismate/anthranilate synthase component II [Nitrososphaerota archaeon]MCZ6724847.1 aminodeoxychorismate/anthranilate synthase component II [Nitrososphaerota archaeon]
MKTLIIDNYDSFVYNIAQLVGSLGSTAIVRRNDKLTLDEVRTLNPDRIVISPGPGTPVEKRYFGICEGILQQISSEVPTLGVCLGHQGIAHAYGGRLRRAKTIMHGKVSSIAHKNEGVFRDVENPFVATRYHSLAIDKASLPTCLAVTAESLDDGEIMGISHKDYPIFGVQFHPESILTSVGTKIMKNFLED